MFRPPPPKHAENTFPPAVVDEITLPETPKDEGFISKMMADK
jgi:hypothetical protein